MNNIIQSLNKEQLQAVSIYDCPLLILAGAGTGKTTTITCRIANLILNNISSPNNILAVTFTNKAAMEMKNRIANLVGENVNSMWIGTFHGLSARILRMFPKAIGLDYNFLIIDDADRKRLLTQISKSLNIDEKRFPYKVLSFIISKLKEKCISVEDEDKISTFKYKDLDINLLYKEYQGYLKGINAVDFDDLIFECIKLFRKEQNILKDIQNRFQFITVDEYQDTNELQHLWLKLLVGSNPNICCVGDEDQSIYGWRGAKVDYILNFSEDFLGAKIVRLENNYRSTQLILNCAINLISNNKQRYDKTLKSNIITKNKPKLFIMENDRDEALQIAQIIIKNHGENINYQDNAVLVRATHQMRNIEDCFIKHNIPYKIIGGIKFYDRKEIKDIIAYLRFAYSLTDKISLERIINTPKRGIGEKGYNDLMKYISDNNFSNILEGLNYAINNSNIFNKKSNQTLITFSEFIKTIHNSIEEMKQNNNENIDLSSIIEKIYHESGYSQMLLDEKEVNGEIEQKIENIREFISSVKQFESIEELLEHVSLVSSTDDSNDNNGVNIMTMHSAKGLEFKYVFLPCWDEGSFPSQKTLEESGNDGIEEERRLAYVAITRAKENFFVFTCKYRNIFGKLQQCYPSRFVEEIKQNIDIEDKSFLKNNVQFINKNQKFLSNNFSKYNYALKEDDGYNDKKDKIYSNKFNKSYYQIQSQDFKQTNEYVIREEKEKQFSIGEIVYHNNFGTGKISNIYSNGKFYEVKFEIGKKMIIPTNKLMKS